MTAAICWMSVVLVVTILPSFLNGSTKKTKIERPEPTEEIEENNNSL
jgi:hypothetical protein